MPALLPVALNSSGISSFCPFHAPRLNDQEHIVFVLSVCLFVCLFICLSVDNFNIHYNFWSIGDRVFIFGMHT